MKIIAASFGVVVALGGPALSCNAEKATYRHMEDKNFTISFAKQKQPKAWSDIQATLHTPSRKLDFEFTASNGYEVQSMVLLTKSVKQDHDIAISFFNKSLKSLGLPESGELAPHYLFAAELGLWLYYAGLDPQDYIPPGMWKLEKCG